MSTLPDLRGAAPSGVKPLAPEDVRFIVVHCSATGPRVDVGLKEVDQWHRLRGFTRVGYHYIIRRDGSLEPGRSLRERGAHVEGHNHESVGVCLIGGTDGTKLNRPQANFTPHQLLTLRTLLGSLVAVFPGAGVVGHRDMPGVAKACPSFDVPRWWESGEVVP